MVEAVEDSHHRALRWCSGGSTSWDFVRSLNDKYVLKLSGGECSKNHSWIKMDAKNNRGKTKNLKGD